MTIKDIAKFAGVSVTTVSMVLNNKDSSISAETRQKVLQVVKQNNFKLYAKAINNSDIRSAIIGLLLPSLDGLFSEFAAAAQATAAKNGYSVIISIYDGNINEISRQIDILNSKNIDGIILFAQGNFDIKEIPADIKTVICSDHSSFFDVCDRYISFYDAARLAVKHLCGLGHKSIAVVSAASPSIDYKSIVSGVKDELASVGIIAKDELFCQVDDINRIGVRTLNKLLYENITAVICSDVRTTARLYAELRAIGANIPNDISVISLSCMQNYLLTPTPVCTNLHYTKLGDECVELVIKKAESIYYEETKRAIPSEISEGESISIPHGFKKTHVVVVGSIHTDCLIHMTHLPTSGESLVSHAAIILPGGKGANQAVGAAKLGQSVHIIGCIGNDEDGRRIYNALGQTGVHIDGVSLLRDKFTGKAYCLVADDGDSTIVYSSESNDFLTPSIIEQRMPLFEKAAYCLLSTEIPWETVLYTINLCFEKNIKVIVKPTTQFKFEPELLKKITYFIPNEKELDIQVNGNESVEEKADCLRKSGVKNLIVTLGAKGCFLLTDKVRKYFPAAKVKVVDTTGAADAFIAAFCSCLCEECDIETAIRFANYAAGISVTKEGVQLALVDRNAFDAFGISLR